jgi:hypothetical protein
MKEREVKEFKEMIQVGLDGFQVFGVTKNNQVGEGVDYDSDVSETVEYKDGLLSKTFTCWSIVWVNLMVVTILSQQERNFDQS